MITEKYQTRCELLISFLVFCLHSQPATVSAISTGKVQKLKEIFGNLKIETNQPFSTFARHRQPSNCCHTARYRLVMCHVLSLSFSCHILQPGGAPALHLTPSWRLFWGSLRLPSCSSNCPSHRWTSRNARLRYEIGKPTLSARDSDSTCQASWTSWSSKTWTQSSYWVTWTSKTTCSGRTLQVSACTSNNDNTHLHPYTSIYIQYQVLDDQVPDLSCITFEAPRHPNISKDHRSM